MLISAKTMPQLNTFIVLFSALVAVAVNAQTQSYKCGDHGVKYFCDKTLNEIHIVMTHNSLSNKPEIYRNQQKSLVEQFRSGVWGFNFDLYPADRSDTKMWTYHGRTIQSYDLTKEIQALVTELKETKNWDEVLVMTLTFTTTIFCILILTTSTMLFF